MTMKNFYGSETLAHALNGLRHEWGLPPSFGLKQFLERWEGFVKSVEKGYDGSLDEYMQSLAIRDSLTELLQKVLPEEREWIAGFLQQWDERLRFTTRPSPRPLAPPLGSIEGFWWSRLPLQLTGQLLEDLQKEGVI